MSVLQFTFERGHYKIMTSSDQAGGGLCPARLSLLRIAGARTLSGFHPYFQTADQKSSLSHFCPGGWLTC